MATNSLPEPPPNVPRIVDVQDPGTGHYVVMVRMPTNLAAKWPDKPWGTAIDAIGLSSKDAELYSGYALVDVEPMKGSPDLYWIFQKLDGPVWTTLSKGQDSLVPAKYRRLVTTTRTKQEVVPTTQPSAITGDLAQSIVEQQDDTGKAVKVNTSETIAVDGTPLAGQLTDQWGVNTTSESLVAEGTAVTSGFGTKASRVVPLGNGKSIKETETYPTPASGVVYKLEDQDEDDTTGIIIDIDKRLVDASQAKALALALRTVTPPANANTAWFTEIKSLDKWHSILIASRVDPATVPVSETWKETGGFSLPNRLTEVGVIWDSNIETNGGSGGVTDAASVESENISWSVGVEAVVTGSVIGRPYTKIENGRSGSASVTVVRTYHYGPPTNTITAHEFKPVYGMLTLSGAQGSMTARGDQSGQGATRAEDAVNYRRMYDANMAIHQFGPVEFVAPLSIQHLGDPRTLSAAVYATTGTLPGSGYYPAVVAALALEGTASLDIPSSTTPLTSGQSYILKVDSRPWRFGWWVREVYTLTVPGTP